MFRENIEDINNIGVDLPAGALAMKQAIEGSVLGKRHAPIAATKLIFQYLFLKKYVWFRIFFWWVC